MGGTKGRAPEAITARRKRSRWPPTSTASAATKRPSPMKTSTPSSVNRRALSWRLMSARSWRIRSMARPKSPSPLTGGAPNRSRAGARVVPGAGGADHRLRRHAAVVEAVAAQQPALDQRHPGAQPGGAGGAHQPGGAGADHHQVVALGRLRVDPGRRVDVVDQPLVVAIERLDEAGDLGVQVGDCGLTHPRPPGAARDARCG